MSSGAVTEGAQDFTGAKTFQMGNGAIPGHNTMGLANLQNTAQGTGADTTEDTLYTYTLPPNAFSVVGKAVRIRVWGTTAANANNKTVKVYFGAALTLTLGPSAANAAPWFFELIVTKNGASTQVALASGWWNGAAITPQLLTGTETDTAAIVIKATGTNGTASANDVAAKAFMVEFLN